MSRAKRPTRSAPTVDRSARWVPAPGRARGSACGARRDARTTRVQSRRNRLRSDTRTGRQGPGDPQRGQPASAVSIYNARSLGAQAILPRMSPPGHSPLLPQVKCKNFAVTNRNLDLNPNQKTLSLANFHSQSIILLGQSHPSLSIPVPLEIGFPPSVINRFLQSS